MLIARRLRSKRGDTLILGLLIVFFALIFTAFIVDIGSAYFHRVQLQHIADAAAIGGANYGARVFKRPGEEARALVQPQVADSKAQQIIMGNMELLPSRIGRGTIRVDINPSGTLGMSTVDQYYSGNYTVRVQGDTIPFLLSSPLFGQFFRIHHTTEARMHVDPVESGGGGVR